MSLTIDLPPDLEAELAAEAARLHMPLPEYVVFAVAFGRPRIRCRAPERRWSPTGNAKGYSAREPTSRTRLSTSAI